MAAGAAHVADRGAYERRREQPRFFRERYGAIQDRAEGRPGGFMPDALDTVDWRKFEHEPGLSGQPRACPPVPNRHDRAHAHQNFTYHA